MKKKVFIIIKWSVFALLILIISTEITLRITCGERLRRWSDFKYQSDTLLGYRYLSGSKGTFCNTAYQNDYFFNSLGFPGDEFSPSKKAGTYRIIIVGASNDIGFNTNGPVNYINLVNSKLKNNKIKAEVINCSIDGGSKEIRKLDFVKGECLTYQPDLILFPGIFPFKDRFRYRTTYKNIRIEYEHLDVYLDSVKTLIDKKIVNKSFKLFLYDYSYIFRTLCKYYFDNKSKDDFKMPETLRLYFKKNEKVLMGYVRGKIFWSVPKPNQKKKPKVETIKYTEEESLLKLKQVSNFLSQKNIRFFFFNTLMSSKNEKLLFQNEGVNRIDLDIQYKDEYSFGEDDGHFSQVGHEVVAKYLYKVLVDSIIPREYILMD